MLVEKIENDLKLSMLKKDGIRVEVLRSLKTAFKNLQVSMKTTRELTDNEVIQVLVKQSKQRLDSYNSFKEANREVLALNEFYENEIILEYLPKEIKGNELDYIINIYITENPEINMGQCIKDIKEIISKQGFIVDGKTLAQKVKELI